MEELDAVCFDLDDTLYPSRDYVLGGYRAAAAFAEARWGLPADDFYARACRVAAQQEPGRGAVFDAVLEEYGRREETAVRLLVLAYRAHRPVLDLFPDALAVLRALRARRLKTGLITDGMGSMQRHKIEALGLAGMIDAVVCTDELGREFWKPSPVPFRVALEWLGVEPRRAAYVADNPAKDFAGPNALGMRTFQVCRTPGGERAAGGLPEGWRAGRIIPSLEKLLD